MVIRRELQRWRDAEPPDRSEMARPRRRYPGSPADEEWHRDLTNAGGPVMTAVTVLIVLSVYGLLLLHGAEDHASGVLKAAAASFAGAAIVACVLTHAVDPGMPEREPDDAAPADPEDEAQRTRERTLPDGTKWSQKWCRECGLWRPHRCGHCHTCGRCVLRLDHHCAWMGTCVGERNARFFAAFLFCAGVGILLLLALAVHRLGEMGCLSRAECWAATWEPVLIGFLFLCCPTPMPNMCCGGCMLSCSGLGYTAQMLTDTDVHGMHNVFRDGVLPVLLRLLFCRGAKTYCCGPVALEPLPCWKRKDSGAPPRPEPECAAWSDEDDAHEAHPLSGDRLAGEQLPGAACLGTDEATPAAPQVMGQVSPSA